jgi:hypothetical protein
MSLAHVLPRPAAFYVPGESGSWREALGAAQHGRPATGKCPAGGRAGRLMSCEKRALGAERAHLERDKLRVTRQ